MYITYSIGFKSLFQNCLFVALRILSCAIKDLSFVPCITCSWYLVLVLFKFPLFSYLCAFHIYVQ